MTFLLKLLLHRILHYSYSNDSYDSCDSQEGKTVEIFAFVETVSVSSLVVVAVV